MKKLSSVILALSLAALSLTGCGSTGTADTTTTAADTTAAKAVGKASEEKSVKKADPKFQLKKDKKQWKIWFNNNGLRNTKNKWIRSI